MYKALFVDDNIIQIKSLMNYISWENFGVDEIKVAYDAFEAIDICKNYVPDILITDIVMPEMSGIELIEELKKLNVCPEYIYISCYENVEYLKSAVNNNAVGYIVKPLKPNELEDVVKKAIDKLNLVRNPITNHDMHIAEFRGNFICGVLNSADMTNEDIICLSEELGISKYNRFCVVIIECNETNKHISNIILSELKSKSNICSYIDSNDAIVALFMNKAEDDVNICDFVDEVIKRNVQLGYNNIYTGISNVEKKITDLRMMYAQASKTLEHNKTHHIHEAIDYFNAFNKTQNFNYSLYAQKLQSIIESNASTKTIDKFISELKQIPEASESNIFVELYIFTLSEINKIFTENEISIEQVFGNINFSTINKKRFEDSEIFFRLIYNIIDKSREYVYKFKYEEQFRISENIFNYINENYRTIESIEEVAKELKISYSYARAVFKKENGITIQDYLTFVRIEMAKRLLNQNVLTVSEVAENVGYADVAYFRMVFKKSTGVTPQDFKYGTKSEKE